jgi:hypothetical protein
MGLYGAVGICTMGCGKGGLPICYRWSHGGARPLYQDTVELGSMEAAVESFSERARTSALQDRKAQGGASHLVDKLVSRSRRKHARARARMATVMPDLDGEEGEQNEELTGRVLGSRRCTARPEPPEFGRSGDGRSWGIED